MDIWIWNWTTGGYNWCKADNREDALNKGNAMTSGPNKLVVDENTLRQGTIKDVNYLDGQYASMCD